jgi:hypothetical protein
MRGGEVLCDAKLIRGPHKSVIYLTILSNAMRAQLAARLATQQLKLTVLLGAALVPLFGLAFSLLMYRPWVKHWPSDIPPIIEVGSQALGLSGVLLTTGIAPALLVGWLRILPMRWLLERTMLLPRDQSIALAVGGTLLLFEATVVLPSLLGYWALKLPFSKIWAICTGFSLPWLVGALWATWRVLRQSTPPTFVVE